MMRGQRYDSSKAPATPLISQTRSPSLRVNDPALIKKAEHIVKARRRRESDFVDASLFADPAWDILLGLYIDEGMGSFPSVTAACISAAVPPTTALRWISKLEKCMIIERFDDPFDNRRSYVRLSDVTVKRLNTVLGRY